MKLYCAIVVVGVAGSAFPVEIDESQTVGDLTEVIKKKSDGVITTPVSKLQLFLAKKDGGRGSWLKQKELEGVRDTSGFKRLQCTGDELRAVGLDSGDLVEVSGAERAAGNDHVHVLVEVPHNRRSWGTAATIPITEKDITVINALPDGAQEELEYYKDQGDCIRTKCAGYCEEVLNQIDQIYEDDQEPLPFMCVQGSSGMGKSQLAFALGGRRPWFYWLSTPVQGDSQDIYKTFTGITRAFHEVVGMDGITQHELQDVLNSMSIVYYMEDLWTYGFIRALLDRCSLTESEREHAQMMTFDDIKSLHVKKCSVGDVWNTIARMKKEKKLIPFFILDETIVNSDPDTQKLAAFQRNVFRACHLVVVLMGTDAKINDLIFRTSHELL